MATDCRILLEDGFVLLQEDGTSDFLLESCSQSVGVDTGCDILLEDGGLLLQEDGQSAFLVEDCSVVVVSPTGGSFLIPKGFAVPLEDEFPLGEELLLLIRRRRWRLRG